MKKVLFDATNCDIFRSGGVGRATRAYLNAVHEIMNKKIDVLQCIGDTLVDDSKFETVLIPQRNKINALLSSLRKGYVHCGGKHIVRLAKTGEYSLFFLNSGFFSGAVVDAISQNNGKSIVLHHNYEPNYTMDSKSFWTLGGRTSSFVKHLERKAYLGATVNLFLTEYDKQLFESNYGARNNNFVMGMFEYEDTEPVMISNIKEKTIAISCSLAAPQNIYCLRGFKPYISILNSRFPEWKVILMGRNPPKEILEFEHEFTNVSVIPNPEEIQKECASCCIYLCPMDRGGGLKLRVMDGLRNGMPIITHVVSSRGYDVFFEKDYFNIYNDMESFVNAVDAVVKRGSFAGYRDTIKRDYLNYFSFSAGVERLNQLIKSLL